MNFEKWREELTRRPPWLSNDECGAAAWRTADPLPPVGMTKRGGWLKRRGLLPRGKAIVDAAWAPFLSTSALFRFAAVTVLMRLSRFLKICCSASIERSRRMTLKARVIVQR